MTIKGVDDTNADGDVLYSIVTDPAVSADAGYSGRNGADVSVTNTDDDTAGITVSPTSGLVTTEAGGKATFSVVLTSQPTASVTIPISSSDTSEGVVSPASLTFTPANWSVAQTVSVTGVDDAVQDGDVSYSIVTGPAASNDVKYSESNPAEVTVTNVDDDTAGIMVSPNSGLITTEAGGSATFAVVLRSQPTAIVIISVSSSDPTEGFVSPSALTFTPANWQSPQTVAVTGVDDTVVDGNVGYTIVTAAAASDDFVYSGMNPTDVGVTNVDNDSAGITVTPTSGLITTESGGKATFSVVLDSQPTANVIIPLNSSDPTEGLVQPIAVTFTPADWSAAQTVTVTGVDDAIADGDVGYSIVTGAAASSDSRYSGMKATDVALINTDNDTAGIVVSPTSGLVTTEAGGSAFFTVVLESQPLANVVVGLSSSDAAEGSVSPSALTFTPIDWSLPQTVTVTGVDDDVADGNIAYSISTATATSSDSVYAGMNPADVGVSNADNDTAGITVTPTTGLVTSEAGGKATFSVVLNSQPTANVIVALTSSDSTEGTVSPAFLTFTPADWNAARTVTVTGVDDAVVDGNVVYTIVVTISSGDSVYNRIAPIDVAVTNDDMTSTTVTPPGGGVKSGSVTPPVTIERVQVLPKHRQTPARIVVTLSADVDAAAASNLANYRLAAAGRDKRFGTKDDKVTKLKKALYDAALDTITLSTRGKLSRVPAKMLTIYATNLLDSTGRRLDGDHDGEPGGDFAATLKGGTVTVIRTAGTGMST